MFRSALGVVFAWMERRAAALVVVFAAAIFALARWIVPGTAPARLPALTPSEQIPPLLIFAVAIAALALLLAALSGAAGRKLALPLLLVGALTVDGLLVVNPWRALACWSLPRC